MSLIKVSINDLDIAIALDPAISESLKAARSAAVVAGITPSSRIVLLDYWVERQGDPELIIKSTLDLAKKWMARVIGVETIAYQKALMPYMQKDMRRRSMNVPIIELKPDRNGKIVEKKNQRILSMQPFFKTGQVYIQKGMLDFIEEYETFPMGGTVDILDALSYLFRIIIPKEDSKQPAAEGAIERLTIEDPSAAKYWRAYGEKKGYLKHKPDPLEDDTNLVEERFVEGLYDLCS